MVAKDESKILEYLKKYGQTNKFKLATQLGIDIPRILNIISKLEEKQAITTTSGIVRFLKFPVKEKKAVKKVIKAPKPKKEVKHKKTILEITQAENRSLKERILELEATIKRQISIKNKKIREQAGIIEELQQKASAPPKIIRRTIVKKIPKIVTKTIIKEVPIKPQRFKLPKINLSGLMKNIKRLDVPEVLKK